MSAYVESWVAPIGEMQDYLRVVAVLFQAHPMLLAFYPPERSTRSSRMYGHKKRFLPRLGNPLGALNLKSVPVPYVIPLHRYIGSLIVSLSMVG